MGILEFGIGAREEERRPGGKSRRKEDSRLRNIVYGFASHLRVVVFLFMKKEKVPAPDHGKLERIQDVLYPSRL